jgi:hypothetical protein
MKTEPNTTIEELHQTYCRTLGEDIQLTMRPDRERAWLEFIKQGYTKQDLVAAIEHIRNSALQPSAKSNALLFRNLIERLDNFEDEMFRIKIERALPKQKTPEPEAEKPRTIWELTQLIKAKQEAMDLLEDEFAYDGPFGLVWQNEKGKQDHAVYREQLSELHHQLAAMK